MVNTRYLPDSTSLPIALQDQVFDVLADDTPGEGASLVTLESGVTVQDAFENLAVPAAPQGASLIGFKRPEAGATNQTVYAQVKKMMWVTDFENVDGSKVAPDGVTVSTTGLDRAIAAASIYGEQLNFPAGPGPIVTEGNVIPATGSAISMVGHSSNYGGASGYPSASLMLAPGLAAGTRHLLDYAPRGDSDDYDEIIGLNLYGNKAANPLVTTSTLINLQADTSTYPRGIRIYDSVLSGAKTKAIFVGNKRRSVLEGMVVYDCGSSTSDIAIDIDTFDMLCRSVYASGCIGIGWYFRSGAQQQLFDCSAFFCERGAVVSSGQSDLQWTGGSFDHNKTQGIEISSFTGGTYPGAGRMFSQLKFLQNGMKTDNTYYDVLVQDNSQTDVLSQCYFLGHAENPALRELAPLGFVNPSARLRTIGCNFALTKFSLGAVANTPTCVEQTASHNF